MKFKITKSLLSAIAFGTFWVASWGSAQALPICAPTYTIGDVSGTTTVTLVANCTPDPSKVIDASSGYNWTEDSAPASIGIGSQYSEPVLTANTHTYNVSAKNTGDSTLGAVASILVNAAPPYYPTCSLSASTTTVAAGASVTLLPNCENVYPNESLSWYSGPGNGTYSQMINPPGGIVFPSGPTTTYYVVGANDYGDAASNSVSVTVTAAVTPPSCGSISPSTPSLTVGSSQGLSVSCSNSPTGYTWRVGGTTLTSCTTNTCTVPAANLPSASAYTASVTASNAGGPSNTVSTTITVTASTSGGGGAPAGCTIVPASWPGNGVQIGYTPIQTMNNGQQFAFQFTVAANVSQTSQIEYPNPPNVGKLLVVSTTPCGFATPVGAACSASAAGNNPGVTWNTTGTAPRGQCKLTGGTTYYFNVRNATTPTGADQCTGTCQYYFGK